MAADKRSRKKNANKDVDIDIKTRISIVKSSSTSKRTNSWKAFLPFALFLSLYTKPALAYLGPGAGLGMIGSLIAILVVGVIIVMGLVVYPMRVMRKKKMAANPKSDGE